MHHYIYPVGKHREDEGAAIAATNKKLVNYMLRAKEKDHVEKDYKHCQSELYEHFFLTPNFVICMTLRGRARPSNQEQLRYQKDHQHTSVNTPSAPS